VTVAAAIVAAVTFSVKVADGLVLHDEARHRDIPIKVYYPIDAGPRPFIVISPGFGGDKDGYAYLAYGWASAGYVVEVVTHEGTDRPALLEFGASISTDQAKSFAQQVLRTGDISFAISSIPQLEQLVPSLAHAIDASRVGVAGHSMGAGTALLIAGATAQPPGGPPASFRDARVRAAIAMSPQGPGEEGFYAGSWSPVAIPVMTMSGTLDAGIGGQDPTWRLAPFAAMTGENKYQVTVQGAGHLAFALGGTFAPCILAETVAFWHEYLASPGFSVDAIGNDGPCFVTHK